MYNAGVEIVDLRGLSNSISLSETLAQWFVDGFGDEGASFQEECSWLRQSLSNTGPLPVTFVAMRAGVPLGTARIFEHEMPDRPEWNPWFGYFYIHPAHRGQGLSLPLYNRVLQYALSAGITHAYIYTRRSTHRLHELGWSSLECRDWLGGPVTVLRKDLTVECESVSEA